MGDGHSPPRKLECCSQKRGAMLGRQNQTKPKRQVFRNKNGSIYYHRSSGREPLTCPCGNLLYVSLSSQRPGINEGKTVLEPGSLCFFQFNLSYLHFWIFSGWGNVTLWNTFLILFLIQEGPCFYSCSCKPTAVIVFILTVAKGEFQRLGQDISVRG